MLIVEIHGLKPAEAGDVRDILTAMLLQPGFSEGSSVEIYPTTITPVDLRKPSQEYIEVRSNNPQEISLVLVALRVLHLGINVLHGQPLVCHSAEEMR